MNLYVIGPVSGIESNNRPQFERVRDELIATGKHTSVMIPHYFVPEGTDWRIAMGLCVMRMMERWNECLNGMGKHQEFGIAMLAGWNQSRGAVIEYTLAQQLNIPCKTWKEWL